jgi:tetratricopeptide (TPR) repeat protein
LSALEALLTRGQPRSRRALWTVAALALVGAVGLGVGGYFAFRPRPSRDWTQPLWQRRAIASAVVSDGNGDDGGLARVLDERLRDELALGGELRVVPADLVERVRAEMGGVDFASVDRAGRTQLRERLGCQLLLAGRARRQPDGMVKLTVEVRDAVDGRPRAWAEELAAPDALGPLTTKLSARLRRQLALQPPSPDDEAREHAAFPASPALAQQYAEGLAALRRFDADGARKSLEAVVAADPQQPLAWAALAEAWRQLGYQQRQHEAARQAFDRANALPREQRLWVEAQAREANREWPEAIELYRTLASFFPDNLEYGLRLAQAQLTGGHAPDAEATLTRLSKLPPPDGNDPRIDLMQASARSRDNDHLGALQLLDRAQKRAQAADQRQLLALIRQAQCQALLELVRTDEALAPATTPSAASRRPAIASASRAPC